MGNVLITDSGSRPFVDVSSVSLRYGEDDVTSKLALEGTSLTIDRGEFAAVVGPSGCGKSTLLQLLSGLRLPDIGRVNVDGKQITKPINSVGMAFQNPIMLPWRSTMDNILLPLEVVEPHRRRIRNRDEYAKYVEAASVLLRQVGLTKVERTFPWQLSGGMQQRVSLCRALIHTPKLLLLDEPFGALDAFTREELWDVLQGLREQHNFTVLLVTHDLTEAVYLADSVHVMSPSPGRIDCRLDIDIPRPRTSEVRFTKQFMDYLHELRAHIGRSRQTTES